MTKEFWNPELNRRAVLSTLDSVFEEINYPAVQFYVDDKLVGTRTFRKYNWLYAERAAENFINGVFDLDK